MPELPEVETVVRHLRRQISGKDLLRLQIFPNAGTLLDNVSAKTFNRLAGGQRIVKVRRRAKYIVLDLHQGCITVHLRMTGKLFLDRLKKKPQKHLRAAFLFTDGSALLFEDFRKFGKISYYSDPRELDNSLGVEPLSRSFSIMHFTEILNKRKRMIKPLLLDQKLVAGLGNIYTDEALWRARIHPETVSCRISAKKIASLHQAIKQVLRAGIRHSGTTFSTFSFEKEELGRYVDKLLVFGRDELPCCRCQATIKKTRVGGRGTHFCPRCQRKP